jgi:Lrp/AsnC family transcriptional regulator for asnA, asnC and gidA
MTLTTKKTANSKELFKHSFNLMQLLNQKIQPIDGVSRTETFISLEQQIERQIQL